MPQKICRGHSDGKMFENGKFLKHSLPAGHIAGLGRDVGSALVKDTPKWQLLQENIIGAHETSCFQTYSRPGMAGHHFRDGAPSVRRNASGDWPSAGSKVPAGERDSRHVHLHPMTFWPCTAASA